jgi:hypothetical protein
MSTADPSLSHFAKSLEETLRRCDTAKLRDYLQGGFLPPMGQDLESSEILRQALHLIPQYPDVAHRAAGLLATLIQQEADTLRASAGRMDPSQEHLLLEAFRLAAELPAGANLFAALRRLTSILQELRQGSRHSDTFLVLLLRALSFQQVDDSVEGLWLAILEELGKTDEAWTAAQEALLFTAWRGLLWIPPPYATLESPVINMDRVERGLLAIEHAVAGRTQGRRWLQHALDVLTETYPRSPDFWMSLFESRVSPWPSALKTEVFRKWPRLKPAPSPASLSEGPHQSLARFFMSATED